MKKLITTIVLTSFLLVACGGKTPHPVAQIQPGDDYMNCGQINKMITDNNNKIVSLFPKTKKMAKNAALGAAGYFLIVPWFFMDFSDAERLEIDAYQQRNDWLRTLANRKHCDMSKVPHRIKFKKPANANRSAI